jgi:hypothetical protein
MRKQLVYLGYAVNQSLITRQWYADPIDALTTEERLTAYDAATIKALIEQATAIDQRPNPWELPRCGYQEVLQAA